MNKTLKFIASILIVFTFGNLVFTLFMKQEMIIQLKKQNQLLARQKEIYQSSVELILDINAESFPDTFDNQYLVYFPSQACSKCLEDLLLIIENDLGLEEKLIVYFDNPERASIIDRFNDMYGTNYNYITGVPLFHKEQSKISILKINKKIISGALLVSTSNIQEIKSLLQFFTSVPRCRTWYSGASTVNATETSII